MKPRPVLCTTAALTALALCATTGTAAAATSTKPRGAASSALNLLSVQAGGHALSIGGVALSSDTLDGTAVAGVEVTPLTVDGTAYGKQDVTPASGPMTVGSQTSPGALAGLVNLVSPSFSASADDTPSSKASSSSLGSLQLLGLNVPLAGAVGLGSSVDGAAGALATKTVVLHDVALPSIKDLLAALGLDLNALPVATLTALVDQLSLVTATVDSAQAALTAAAADVDAKVAALASSNAALATATAALSTVVATVDKTAYPVTSTLAGYLSILDKTAVNASTGGLSTSLASYTTASGLVAAANAALNTAQAVLATATTALTTALTAVLDGTPLVSLDRLEISSRALTTSASKGGQTAEVVGGQVQGLHVLGTDVLKTALGSSTLDVLGLVGSVTTAVNGTIAGLTGTLSSVLSGVTGLSVPAPKVALLSSSATTGIKDGFGQAQTAVSGLKITLPAITVPSSLAVPGAAALPGLTGVTQVLGSLTSAPLQLDLVTLSDQSAFAPAVTTPTTVTPGVTPPTTPGTTGSLPRTGLPAGIALIALLTVGGAVVVRRRALAG